MSPGGTALSQSLLSSIDNSLSRPLVSSSWIFSPDSPGPSASTSQREPSEAPAERGQSDIPELLESSPPPHSSWRLARVLLGHTGWVRSLCVDPSSNEFLASGANDGTIKLWDLAAGTLKATLRGSVGAVRGVLLSARHPYLFSCGEDHMARCWDLEVNRAVRTFRGHASGVSAIADHPRLDLIVTGGRDSTCRLWDLRVNLPILTLSGHTGAVASLAVQTPSPALITGSADSTIKLWDLVAGRCFATLTHNKKSVRAIKFHPLQYAFAAVAGDSFKGFQCPEGRLIKDFPEFGLSERALAGSGQVFDPVGNCLDFSSDGALWALGSEQGALHIGDWKSGKILQTIQQKPIKQAQAPLAEESSVSEASEFGGILSLAFDGTGSRLATAATDKTIRIYKKRE